MKLTWLGFTFSIQKTSLPPPVPAPPSPLKPADDSLLSPSCKDFLNTISEGILIIDHSQHIVLCNKAMSPLLNRPYEDIKNLTLLEVIRHRELGDLAREALSSHGEDTKELDLAFSPDNIWHVSARLFLSPNGFKGIVLTFSNLTNIRKLENMRKDFVANVSHELKTPLTALKASLETLLEGALNDPRYAKEFLETAQNQVERLQRLIDDLLTISMLEKEDIKKAETVKTPLQKIAKKVMTSLKHLSKKRKITLETQFPQKDILMPLTSDELTQVLMNLLDNAIKFNKPNGTVLVSAEQGNQKITLSVKDTGIGIPSESQPRIFERFYRVDKARTQETGGTGLGLSIVKHIIENHQGTIRVTSAPEQGSEFVIEIPL